MDSNLANRVPQIIEIDEDVVIDLDGAEKTPEEVIYEWDAKIRRKLSMFGVADNENVLGDLMKEYLQSLQEMARSYEDNESLKNKVFCHISFLYSYYVELECCTPDNYLTNMEDILTTYCNLELEVIRPVKKKDFSRREYKRRIVLVCKRIIHVLTVFLLEHHDHILHVLIKMNTNNISDSCSEVLNVLYRHFLTKVPAFNLCDESFCRSYIMFQKWKEIRKVEDWEGMDKIMYKMFKRTPESIKNSETLRQILMPSCQSTVGIVLNLFRSFQDISAAYFKHIISKKNVEMDELDFNIDLGEDEPIIPVEDDNEEEVTFLKAYYEVERNMSNLTQSTSEPCVQTEVDLLLRCKEEVEEDDDVEFVGIVTAEPQVTEKFVIEANFYENGDEKEEEGMSNLLNIKELENLNGITKTTSPVNTKEIAIETEPVPITSCPVEPNLPEIVKVSGGVEDLDTNQPKVPLVSNTTQSPSPSVKTSDCEMRTKDMKSVEVQAGSNYVYDNYGLTTPPFDVSSDEQIPRTVESCVYTPETRSIEVQVDPPSDPKDVSYNDFGLTPPNDTTSDDHRVEETNCLYTDIGQNHKQQLIESGTQVDENAQIEPEINREPDILPNTKKKRDGVEETGKSSTPEPTLDYDIDNQIDLDTEYDTEEIDVESCHEPDKDDSSNHTTVCDHIEPVDIEIKLSTDLVPLPKEAYDFPSNAIDTGQKIPNTAPSIDPEPKDFAPSDIFNGSTVLKPLLASNRTNGQTKEAPTKIMYTSSQKIKSTSLDDFTKFESAIQVQWSRMKENHDFEEILSGPVTKITPSKHSLLNPQDKMDLFGGQEPRPGPTSRSNSPAEMTSPAYEDIDDFRNYFSDSVNGRVPPPHDVKVPQGILKKSNSTRRKNHRIMFHESTCDPSEERRARSDGVLVPKSVRRDRKLNMEPRVVVERLSFIENKMKKVLNNPPTLRVDYDKTTRHINEKDVVRCISPPRFSWIIDFSRSRAQGSLTVKNRDHLEKKPKKRKSEPQNNSVGEPVIRRKRGRPRKNP